MIFAVRKKNENNEKLMRRFKRQIQNANIVRSTREKRYFKKDKTKSRIRDEAIKRDEYRQKKIERILLS
jgi:ribosomal protein S21